MIRRPHDIPDENRTAASVMFADHPDVIRLRASRVLVVGSGRSAAVVAHALAESGIGAVRMVSEAVNVQNVLDGCSVILMGKTDPITRVLINRMSIQKRLPVVYGAATDFTGMVTTMMPDQTPCLECLFGRKEMEEQAIGMVEPMYSVVASIQSLEAVKILLGVGPLLLNRLLIINGMSQSYRKIELAKNPDCPACFP
ncbi:HesA/MoeB/ThiF family protein [Desulfatirhabdium butyrativorans]|uniref:HesA/MoeB/ThiF family protein n=1 Tax=Desulfatirhabdium butyrativorans TaxID=340467 RepID=UPI00040EC6A1|nr:ThiF family adenylyltransferase [Desulfatirhabdium butyrativorans]